ncbi:hypothetical protein KUCAC02_026280, partial [Chaenocephalus aceratus]
MSGTPQRQTLGLLLQEKRGRCDDLWICRGTWKERHKAFTVKATMKNSVVVGPPAAGAFRERPPKSTTFRTFYERGEFPMALQHDAKGNYIAWK